MLLTRSAALACIVLGLACAPSAPPPLAPVVVVPPPVAISTEPVAPAPPPPAPHPSAAAFVGTWDDPSTAGRTSVEVKLNGDTPVVVSIKESTGELETYNVESSSFEHGRLRWVYYVPSTRYRVEFTGTKVTADEMPCTWSNSAGATGAVNLLRVHKPR
jgi:hypothetical protein